MTEFVSGSHLFDGDTMRSGGCVVVEDGLIVGVEEHVPDQLPDGATRLDFDGGCVLPGFVDAHNHLGLDDDEAGNDEAQMAGSEETIRDRACRMAETDIRSGVTTLRAQGEREYWDKGYKQAIDAGEWLGPRLLTSGPWITPTHGHGAWPFGADIADGVEEVRRAVRRHVKAKVAVVKIMISGGLADSGQLAASYYTADEINTAVQEAHNLGLRVSAHCYGGPGARYAVEAGIDTLEHAARLTDPDLLDQIAARGIYLVQTLGVLYKYAYIRESASRSLQAALAAGVKVAIGSDTVHGRIAFDAEVAVRYGATPSQALVAMTRGSAEASGVLDTVGTLEVGKKADLVVVEGNPVDDITSLAKVQLVMKGGATVHDARYAVA